MPSILASGAELQRQIAESLRANPQATFGPSASVAYPPQQPSRPEGWIGSKGPPIPPVLPDWARPGYVPPEPYLPPATSGPFKGVPVVTDRINAAPAPPVSGVAPFANPAAAPTPTPTPQTPNFDAHPGILAARNAENLGLAELENQLKRAREQMIIRFGDPQLASMAGFGLDPQAGTFARQNYLSGNADLARIDKGRDRRRKAIIDRLAATGLLRSGELGYQEGQANEQYGQEVYDARSQVLQKLNELMENYLGRKQALRGGTVNAFQGAYQDFLSNPDLYLGIYGGR